MRRGGGIRLAALPVVLLAVLLVSACAPAQVERADGGIGPTIVSLNPCSDAILAEVAAPGQLLAVSHYSHDPRGSSMDLAQARRYPATRGTVEEIAMLRPDVVIGSTFTPPSMAAALDRLGIRLERIGVAATVAESKIQIRQLAAVAGQPLRGQALIARIDTALAKAAPADAARPSALVWQGGGIVPGPQTLIADVLARAGFANAAAARGLGQADRLPLEAVLADPPRVILAAGSAHGEEDRALRHPALAHLAGTTRARLDPALLWCGGPTIPRLAARLAQVRRSVVTP